MAGPRRCSREPAPIKTRVMAMTLLSCPARCAHGGSQPTRLLGVQALVGLAELHGHTEPMDGVATDRLGELVGRGGVCVLSGAGLSTESGIPDYRGPSGALRARLPMTIAEFRGSPAARQRYWARAHIGWRRIAAAQPNAGHRAVTGCSRRGWWEGSSPRTSTDYIRPPAPECGRVARHA